MNHGGNGNFMSKLGTAEKTESESADMGPVAQRFFKAVIAVAFFLAPILLLYTLYVFISIFIFHRNP